jgi:hypothetical protein
VEEDQRQVDPSSQGLAATPRLCKNRLLRKVAAQMKGSQSPRHDGESMY